MSESEGIEPRPSAEEAAAVIAAVEQFLRDTAPAATAPAPPMNPWLRAGLFENVGLHPDERSPW